MLQALLGGLQVCALADGKVAHVRVPLARPITIALFVPDVPMPTREARSVIPRRVELHDAVYNISRACLLVAALASATLMPSASAPRTCSTSHRACACSLRCPCCFMRPWRPGALGVYLSGAGLSVAAFVSGDGWPVANAMAEAAGRDSVTDALW